MRGAIVPPPNPSPPPGYATALGLFHTGDQFGATAEVRPGDCIDLNGAFHTWSWSDIWSYDTNFGSITLNLDPAGRATNLASTIYYIVNRFE